MLQANSTLKHHLVSTHDCQMFSRSIYLATFKQMFFHKDILALLFVVNFTDCDSLCPCDVSCESYRHKAMSSTKQWLAQCCCCRSLFSLIYQSFNMKMTSLCYLCNGTFWWKQRGLWVYGKFPLHQVFHCFLSLPFLCQETTCKLMWVWVSQMFCLSH